MEKVLFKRVKIEKDCFLKIILQLIAEKPS